MKRWDFLRKGETFFFEGPPAPSDCWVLIDGNKTLGAFFSHPRGGWLIIYNPLHFGWAEMQVGVAKFERVKDETTLVEMKDLCEQRMIGKETVTHGNG